MTTTDTLTLEEALEQARSLKGKLKDAAARAEELKAEAIAAYDEWRAADQEMRRLWLEASNAVRAVLEYDIAIPHGAPPEDPRQTAHRDRL